MSSTLACATELATAGRPASETEAAQRRGPSVYPRRPDSQAAADARRADPAARNRRIARYSPRTTAPLSGSAYHVLFSDYVLFSSQQEVMSMGAVELGMLADVLQKCLGLHIEEEALRLGCDLERSRYIFTYSSSRHIDRLIAATQFMTALAGYNRAIGRETLAGTAVRLATIHDGLSAAVRLARADSAANADPDH